MKKITFLVGLFLASCITAFAQVPSKAPDVMLQGFYWDSYTDKGYGRTKWTDLQTQVDEIAGSFDLVWLPPSANSSGGTGYLPKEWCNQSGAWGDATQLKALIAAFKAKNTRCVADIVINHRIGNYKWTDFCDENFGTYGNFKLYDASTGDSRSLICKDDECVANGYVATGNNDSGYGYDPTCDGVSAKGAYCAARDLDHSNTTVQNAIKAYLKWMKGEMGYDGWRYDLVKGYWGGYTKIYNNAAGAYMSVGEYWDGDYNAVKNWITDTDGTSMAFDFPNKYAALNDALKNGNYQGMGGGYAAPPGLCGSTETVKGKLMKAYAVTFVDNHDTFRDGSNFSTDGNMIVKANAYILSIPGVPCVFYPHWKNHKADIKKMIAARKSVGIHSESPCTTEGSCGSYYKGTTTGSNGTLICFIGGGWSAPSGYTLACSGNGWAYYTKGGSPMPDPDPTPDPTPDPDPSPDPTPSQSYAIRVNGTTDYPATYMGKAANSDHEEYMVSVQLNAGDTFVTYDLVNKAGWVMVIEPYGEYANFTAGTSSVTCNKAGCYDFYIKMMYQNDTMYIGPGTNCGSPAPTPDPEPDPDPTPGPTPDPTLPTDGYGIVVNGTDNYPATYMGKAANSDHEEYMVSVPLNAGDTFVTYDYTNKASWVMAIEPYGEYANFTAGTSSVTCNVAGCYDFYIKMMYQNDSMYIGPGTNCGTPTPTPDPTPDPDPTPTPDPTPGLSTDYYLIGYIDGADYGSGETDWENLGDYKFVNGKVTATFKETSYVYVKTGDLSKWFMAEEYVMPSASGASGVLYATSANPAALEKIGVPAGTVTFTLKENADGTITLSYTMSGQTTSIEDALAKNATIYPNPTTGKASIVADQDVNYVVVRNLIGKTVASFNSNQIDLSNLAASMYLVEIQFANGESTVQKLIKK